MIVIMVNYNELRDLKTKEGAMAIIDEVKNSPFPK